MPTIPIRKFFGAIPSRDNPARPRHMLNARGQGMLEYILVLIVVLGVVLVAARPLIAKLQKQFESASKSGIFKEDPSGSNFYYYPLK